MPLDVLDRTRTTLKESACIHPGQTSVTVICESVKNRAQGKKNIKSNQGPERHQTTGDMLVQHLEGAMFSQNYQLFCSVVVVLTALRRSEEPRPARGGPASTEHGAFNMVVSRKVSLVVDSSCHQY